MAVQKHIRNVVLCLVAVCLAGLTGCGGSGRETVPVRGTVTWDGQPLADAAVMFSGPEGGSPVTARTDANGIFTVQAVVGSNAVAVAKVDGSGPAGTGEDGMMPASGAVTAKSVLPPKYADLRNSGLTVEVAPGMGEVNLELVSQ
jgi:hypothetical protein